MAQGGVGLSTFAGVFTPSLLTILGVIMYLRFGWVVGQVGLLGTLLIVTLATSITLLTGLSIAAIATDQRVRVGGAYYMISRSLGIEAGGAVGLPLYFAQALSVALYTIGFAESLSRAFPVLDPTMVGLVTTVLVTLLALVSARAAIRAQYLIMAAIALSLISFVFGHPVEAGAASDPGAAVGFWAVFAVFFPAVTGIMAGVNMSGDLRDPRRAIPIGTLAAILTGYLIYMVLPLLLFFRADAADLIADPLIMRRMAFWGDAILLGVWGATLSSAVGSVLGAPRVLQALARDGVLPRPLRWLGQGSGRDDSPRLGTLVTMGVALVAVAFGNLDAIAPVLSMFFLTTYGVLNVVAGLERFLSSPSFRPTFRVHWSLSLLGAFGCVTVMVLINPWATLVAVVVVATVYAWLEHRSLQVSWGDVRQGVWMLMARAGLMRLDMRADPKNWRPHLLVFSGAPSRRWYLIELASAIAHDKALMSVATVLTDEGATPERQAAMEGTLRDYLAQRGVQALLKVIRASDPFVGMERLVDVYGLGPLQPNTIMLGGSERPSYLPAFAGLVAHIYRSRRNLVVVHHHPERGFGARRRIDVWWGGLRGNGGLMVTLAYLLQTGFAWKGAEVCLKMMVPNEDAAEGAETNLRGIVRGLRMEVRLEVLVASGRSFDEVLSASSHDADLVLMGMRRPRPDEDYARYYQEYQARIEGLPTTALVLAAEEIAFGALLGEEEG